MTKQVLLSTERDGDLGIVPAHRAKCIAQEAANESGLIVCMRDPTSDKWLGTVRPRKTK
jgi:hypothetical protein